MDNKRFNFALVYGGQKNRMKVTWRIWLLFLAVAISVVSIISSETHIKMLVFLLIIGILVVLNFVSSKTGRFFLILIFVVIGAFLLFNSSAEGVSIKSIDTESIAFTEGLREGQVITHVNGQEILSVDDYSSVVEELSFSNESKRLDITTMNSEHVLFISEPPNLVVEELRSTNIQTGLDIRGGSRALVKADQDLTDLELQELIDVSRNRLNVFGISDVEISGVTDLEGNKFMLVEVAGATPEDLENLISQQGKFEARIGNQTAFIGGDEDITNVCRNDATCASVTGCSGGDGGAICRFSFTITLSPDAAERHADITRDISIDPSSAGQYLAENLTLVLDDNVVDTLLISTNLRGQVTSQISIQGSGQGANQEEAFDDARESMNQLQTILITGSLPYQLEIVKLDTISPTLGSQFTSLLLLAGASSIFLVGIIVFVRYRRIKISLALLATAFSELLIILGIASLINWNLDLPSIAGILATVGTGVDQQIVILDEARSGGTSSLRSRMKRALFIVFAAYFTSMVAFLPLYWAGAGLFKGFAFTSIIGITAGVFITRPAFADMIRAMEK